MRTAGRSPSMKGGANYNQVKQSKNGFLLNTTEFGVKNSVVFLFFSFREEWKELFTMLFTCKGTVHLRFLAGLLELIFVNLDVSRASIVFLFTLDSD